jgi:hypothetical protein
MHYLKIKKSNFISNGSVQTMLSGLGRNDSHKKIKLKKSVCHSSNGTLNAIPDQVP